MCGIIGMTTENMNPGICARFCEATRRLRHRGPDDEGMVWLPAGGKPQVFTGDETGPAGAGMLLGHRRLSILDLSAAGHQPMAAADGRVWITYNGEIYNFCELRTELADGFDFRTGTDTEVILAAWLKWGRGMLSRLEGMFALGIADLRDAERPLLFLARDPFGIKPLYYAEIGGALAFASEIKALLTLGAAPVANAARVFTYFTEGCTDYGEATLFAGIFQVPAGGWMELRPGPGNPEPEHGRFWNPDRTKTVRIDRREAAEELRRLFMENIRLHLRSDVPVGAALSGGIDSSSIVCGIREVNPGAAINTFSFIPEDEAKSEERWMDTVSGCAATIPHKTRPSAGDLMAGLGDLMDAHDEPFATSSVFAQYQVFALAKRAGIKVMLDGQGADELLGGYAGFAALRLATLIGRGQWGKAMGFAWTARQAVGGGGWPLVRSAGADLLGRSGRRRTPEYLRGDWFRERGVASSDLPVREGGGDRLRAGLWHSALVNSLPRLLRFEDRNSMAHSVESRVPFLTPRLAEFILALPEELLIADDGTSKSIFREAMRGLTPDAVLDRRDKMGFDTPERAWLLHPAARARVSALLASDEASGLPFIRMETVRRNWAETLAGRQPCPDWLWRVLCCILWVQVRGVRCA